MNINTVYFIECCDLTEDFLASVYHLMPVGFQAENSHYSRFEDRRDRLAVRLLLLCGLREFGALPQDGLARLSADSFGRPFLPGVGVDFSFTHSDGLAAVALSSSGRVGIDVEKTREIDVNDYLCALTNAEAGRVKSSASPYAEFLRLWTRKEALLKAYGSGLLKEPSRVEILDDEVSLGGRLFYISVLDIAPGCVAHAASESGRKFNVVRVSASSLR